MKKIIAYKHYYQDFMKALAEQERKKVLRALLLLQTEEKVPHHYIKYLRDGIYELRQRNRQSSKIKKGVL